MLTYKTVRAVYLQDLLGLQSLSLLLMAAETSCLLISSMHLAFLFLVLSWSNTDPNHRSHFQSPQGFKLQLLLQFWSLRNLNIAENCRQMCLHCDDFGVSLDDAATVMVLYSKPCSQLFIFFTLTSASFTGARKQRQFVGTVQTSQHPLFSQFILPVYGKCLL